MDYPLDHKIDLHLKFTKLSSPNLLYIHNMVTGGRHEKEYQRNIKGIALEFEIFTLCARIEHLCLT